MSRLWKTSDVEFAKGAITGVDRTNGAGKTTLLQLIRGVQMPNGGKIIFRGEDITRRKAHVESENGNRPGFQVVQPLTGINVAENVTTAALFGRNGARRSVHEAREFGFSIFSIASDCLREARNYMSALTLADSKRLELARAFWQPSRNFSSWMRSWPDYESVRSGDADGFAARRWMLSALR